MADALGPAVLTSASPVSSITWQTHASEHAAALASSRAESHDHAAAPQRLPLPTVTVVAARASVRARRVIVAVPPNLVHRIAFQPALPPWRTSLHASLTQGHVIKILAVYPTPFWRAMGLSGEGFAPHSCSAIKEIYDNTPPAGHPGVVCSFLVGDAAVRAAALPGGLDGNDFRDLVLSSLARFLGPCARTADAIVARDWAAEQWTGGGYCGTFGLGGITEHCMNRSRSVGPIVFAATELAGAGFMHMEGALRSGAAAAAAVRAEILAASKL